MSNSFIPENKKESIKTIIIYFSKLWGVKLNIIYEDIKNNIYAKKKIKIPKDELYVINKDKENIIRKFYNLENNDWLVNKVLIDPQFSYLLFSDNYEIFKKIVTIIHSDNTLNHLLDEIKLFGVWNNEIDIFYKEIIINLILDIINTLNNNNDSDIEMKSPDSGSYSPFSESNSPSFEPNSPAYLDNSHISLFRINTPLPLEVIQDTYTKINIDFQLAEITYILNDFYSELSSLFVNYKLLFFNKVILNKYTLRQDKYSYSG